MEPRPDRPHRPRSSTGTLMVLVAVVALDCALLAALADTIPRFEVPAALPLVVCYDLLLYFTVQALRKIIRPGPGERPSVVLIGIAILVLGTCAGLPLMVMVLILLGVPPR